jgi:hypothetical protein
MWPGPKPFLRHFYRINSRYGQKIFSNAVIATVWQLAALSCGNRRCTSLIRVRCRPALAPITVGGLIALVAALANDGTPG